MVTVIPPLQGLIYFYLMADQGRCPWLLYDTPSGFSAALRLPCITRRRARESREISFGVRLRPVGCARVFV